MKRSRPLHDAALAVTLLTAVPLPVRFDDQERTDAASYFPLVGLMVGAVVYVPFAVAEAAGWRGGHAALGATLVLTVWALFTRLLHWDGLADVADAWYAPEQDDRQRILGDSSVGAFGATAIVLVALTEFAALSTLLQQHEVFLLVVPVFARLAATFGAWLGKPARPGGLGASVTGFPSAVGGLVAAAVTLGTMLLTAAAYRVEGVLLVAVAIVSALLIPHVVARRFGGVTGDVLGASILLTETVLFVTAAVLF